MPGYDSRAAEIQPDRAGGTVAAQSAAFQGRCGFCTVGSAWEYPYGQGVVLSGLDEASPCGAGFGAACGCGLCDVAGACSDANIQFQPVPLQFPLVLGL